VGGGRRGGESRKSQDIKPFHARSPKRGTHQHGARRPFPVRPEPDASGRDARTRAPGLRPGLPSNVVVGSIPLGAKSWALPDRRPARGRRKGRRLRSKQYARHEFRGHALFCKVGKRACLRPSPAAWSARGRRGPPARRACARPPCREAIADRRARGRRSR